MNWWLTLAAVCVGGPALAMLLGRRLRTIRRATTIPVNRMCSECVELDARIDRHEAAEEWAYADQSRSALLVHKALDHRVQPSGLSNGVVAGVVADAVWEGDDR